MNKKNLLVAAGLLFLSTACKENKVIVPASSTVQKESPAPKLQGETTDDVVDSPKWKPAKMKDLIPEVPYEGFPILN